MTTEPGRSSAADTDGRHPFLLAFAVSLPMAVLVAALVAASGGPRWAVMGFGMTVWMFAYLGTAVVQAVVRQSN